MDRKVSHSHQVVYDLMMIGTSPLKRILLNLKKLHYLRMCKRKVPKVRFFFIMEVGKLSPAAVLNQCDLTELIKHFSI